MAQAASSGTNEGEAQNDIDLQSHLSKFNVPDRVFTLLKQESITVDELLTFTNKDLEEWSGEHSLKTIERRRFINSIKSLPNCHANKPQFVKIFLGNEEKEQLKKFDDMEKNVKKMIENVNNIDKHKQTNAGNIIKEINNVCNQIQTFVENLRTKLLQKVT